MNWSKYRMWVGATSLAAGVVGCSLSSSDGDEGNAGASKDDGTSDGNESECPPGEVCDDETGTPNTPGVDSIDVPDEPQEPDEPEICAEADVNFEIRIPQVWFVIDRSQSMQEAMDSTDEVLTGHRWEVLGNVLFGDPADANDRGVTGEFDSLVNFGAGFYGRNCPREGIDPDRVVVQVPIAPNNYDNIKATYDDIDPGGNTPTAFSYARVADVARATPETTGPKLIILATDGLPSDCEGDGFADTEAAVDAAFQDDISTRLVFIGPPPHDNSSHEAHLQNVANLGVGLPRDAATPAEYFEADSEEALSEAFASIVKGSRSCILDLEGEVDEMFAHEGTIKLNGVELAYQDENGWRLASENQVELLGSACEEIQEGTDNIDIEFPCGVYVVVR